MNAEPRLAAMRRRLADAEVEAVLITVPANMRYLTGFEGVFDSGINAACLVTADMARFYTDTRYSEAAQEAASGSPWVVRVQKESLYIELCAELQAEGLHTLAIESSVAYGRFKFVSQQFSGRVIAIDGWVEELRQVKDNREIEAISSAAALADEAFEHIVAYMCAGKTEIEVALELEMYLRRNGSEGVAFDAIAAGGPNGARPHSVPTDRMLREGDLVVLDYGACIDGYCCDITRTIAIGTADDRQRQVHAAVVGANEAARAAIRAGMPACDADALARDALARSGLAEHFTHGLGHGVGLSVHESPAVNAHNREPLRAGAVVTVEPGVYVPGWGGVRIEDLVVVEPGGTRLLSHAPRDLIEIR